MPSREELEQECEILSAELEQSRRDLRQALAELEREKGKVTLMQSQASSAGVALTIPSTPEEAERAELDGTRKEIEDDLKAISELHNPPEPEGEKPMTTLDIVRHNNAERDMLNRSLGNAGQLISRIAAIVRVDKWDAEGSEIRAAVQRFEHLSFFIGKKQKDVDRDLSALPKHDALARSELSGWKRALDWCVEKLAMPPAKPGSAIPITAPDGLRFPQGDGTDTIIRKESETVLQVAICRGELVERKCIISAEQLSAEGYGYSQFIKRDGDSEQPYR